MQQREKIMTLQFGMDYLIGYTEVDFQPTVDDDVQVELLDLICAKYPSMYTRIDEEIFDDPPLLGIEAMQDIIETDVQQRTREI
jgi:hypothetical protein